jgi:hypothetical protein
MSTVVTSFSGQKIDLNSSVNPFQEVNTIFPVFISCLIMRSAKFAGRLVLQYERASLVIREV